MKELSIEEKAKRYDEAINRCREFYDTLGNAKLKKEVEEIFPELKESEDERIRKELIAEVKEQIDCIPAPDCRDKEDEKALKQLNKWLAWLEKQGEQKPEEVDNLHNYLYGEQKPAEKWYDFIRWFVKQRTNDYTLIPSDDDIHKWGDNILNHARKVLEKQGKQEPAWSEEDERIYKVVLELMDSYSKGTIGGCIISPNTDRYIKWLKSLKDRVQPQPQQEWSKEDKDYYDAIITKLEVTQEDATLTDNQMNFLKSLKERYTWKPSDEQMKALYNVFNDTSAGWEDSVIESLYNDLKKLREE